VTSSPSDPAGTTVPTLLTGRVVLPSEAVADGAVVVADDRVLYAGPLASLPPEHAGAAAPPGWGAGLTLLPGLVDLHCHGGSGGEFGTDTASARTAAAHHHRAGSTTVVGSLVSAPAERLLTGVRACAPLVREGELAGIHLEGPFLSTVRCGAQNPAALIAPDPKLLDDLVLEAGPGVIAQMTWAPELPGAERLPEVMAGLGILGAVGHTDADVLTARAALATLVAHPVRGGQALVTHLFNGMPPMLSREPGPVAAALSAAGRGEAVLEVIADGVHLDGGTVQMLFDTVGADQLALVSDCMAAAGLPEGEYTLGGLEVRVRGRDVRLVESGSLAGGVSCLLDQVRWCVTELGVPLTDAVRAASETPARALALDRVGALAEGSHADVLVVDDALVAQRVMRRGAWL
jgi:N-acetylglucosamine-6-phosphate deacetylase